MRLFCKKQEDMIKEMRVMINGVNKNIVNSALTALDNVNEMQEFYLDTTDGKFSCGENVLRVYALLQGLFVGIDSLYSLAEVICGSKTFINVNQNKALKTVKYIRNDVVGHPVNRVYENNQPACCILEKGDIVGNHIKYTVYFGDDVETKNVDLLDCLENYYIESNELLAYLYKFYQHNIGSDSLVFMTKTFYDGFDPKNCDVSELRDFYINHYENDNVNQNRFIWRLDLVDKFKDFHSNNKDESEFVEYALYYQVKRLLEMSYELEQQKVDVTINERFPKYLYLFSKFLKSNYKYVDYLTKLKDVDHPYFDKTFINMRNQAVREGNKILANFFDFILKNKDNGDFIYLIGAVFKTIKL